MKQYAIDYFGREDGYEVWYKTPRQKSEKFRFFETLDDLKEWCKRHKQSATIMAGSWQAFELIGQ